MNKKHIVTSDTFEQCQASQLFFELNIANNEDFNGYDILVNIDTQETAQIMRIAQDLYTFEQRYSKAVNIIGIDRILPYAPKKLVDAIEKNGIENLDKHLNGIVRIETFYINFSNFVRLMGSNKNKLSKYDIINSYASWTCLIKQALRMKYSKN